MEKISLGEDSKAKREKALPTPPSFPGGFSRCTEQVSPGYQAPDKQERSLTQYSGGPASEKGLSAVTISSGEGMRKEFPLSVILAFLIVSRCDADHEREIPKKAFVLRTPSPRSSAQADAQMLMVLLRDARGGHGQGPGRGVVCQGPGLRLGRLRGMSLPNFRRTGCCGLVCVPGQGEWSSAHCPEKQDRNDLQKQLLADDRVKRNGNLPCTYLLRCPSFDVCFPSPSPSPSESPKALIRGYFWRGGSRISFPFLCLSAQGLDFLTL